MKIKCKGIIRDRFNMLHLKKQANRNKQSRFAKKNMSQSYEMAMLTPTTINKPLIEPPTEGTLSIAPEWIEHYDHCYELIRKKQMMICHAKRLASVKETEQHQIQNQLYDLAKQATMKIKKCEGMLKKIQKQSQLSSLVDQRTCRSVCTKLAIQIQSKTKQIKAKQKAFIQSKKQMQESSKVTFLELAAQKMLEDDDEGQEQIMSLGIDVELRKQQIDKIVESVEELNEIYKQLNNLIIMQGTLLDRIDYNIEDSYIKVKQGNQHLQKAQKKQQSKLACRFMLLLLAVICILGIVLIVKWSN